MVTYIIQFICIIQYIQYTYGFSMVIRIGANALQDAALCQTYSRCSVNGQ